MAEPGSAAADHARVETDLQNAFPNGVALESLTMKAILLVILWLAAAACEGPRVETRSPPDQPTHRSSGGTMGAIGKDTATTMATKGLQDLRRDPGRYDVTVSETDIEWQVRFAGKQPRPPGDEVTFYVNKQTGAIRHLLGE